MSRDYHAPLRNLTADTGNTASAIVACLTVFTELLPGNALIKSVTVRKYQYLNRSVMGAVRNCKWGEALKARVFNSL
jgi:hypothetical protein